MHFTTAFHLVSEVQKLYQKIRLVTYLSQACTVRGTVEVKFLGAINRSSNKLEKLQNFLENNYAPGYSGTFLSQSGTMILLIIRATLRQNYIIIRCVTNGDINMA